LNVGQGSSQFTFQAVWRQVAPGGTCPPPDDFFYCSNIGVVDSVGMIYGAFGDASKVGLLVFPELWLGIGVKHVVFLELWLIITSLELWLGMADEHEEPLSSGSGWRVLQVWVCWLWPVRMGPDRLSSSVVGWRVW